MWVQFTNLDSSGRCATRRLAITLDGERCVIEPAGTGAAQVPEAVGQHLVDSDGHAVERRSDE